MQGRPWTVNLDIKEACCLLAECGLGGPATPVIMHANWPRSSETASLSWWAAAVTHLMGNGRHSLDGQRPSVAFDGQRPSVAFDGQRRLMGNGRRSLMAASLQVSAPPIRPPPTPHPLAGEGHRRQVAAEQLLRR